MIAILLTAALLFVGLGFGQEPLSINDFGAQPNTNSYEAAVANGVALFEAMTAANSGTRDTRTVIIPADTNYYMLPAASYPNGFENMNDVTLLLEGTVWAWTDDISKWPVNPNGGGALNLFIFTNCSRMTVGGTGIVEGQGYWWWWDVIVTGKDNRPNLFYAYICSDLVFTGWTLRNSPQYHVLLNDIANSFVYNITIHVDIEDQASLLESFGLMSTGTDGFPIGIPTFPLNTDGIDVSGHNITVRGCRVQNFDDSVCLKPLSGRSLIFNCTENVLFEDIDITFGVGASTGSVGPNPSVNCIRNCTFRDIRFKDPIKAIYVKPNPGNEGSGIIDHITYENIVANNTLWWSIWVSTQQQDQPGGGTNTHCSFFYPLDNTTCATQPLVPVTNLVLRNVTMTGAWLSPGVLRCNTTNPCTGWLFEDVSISSATNYPVGDAFLCDGIVDSQGINVSPSTDACFNTGRKP